MNSLPRQHLCPTEPIRTVGRLDATRSLSRTVEFREAMIGEAFEAPATDQESRKIASRLFESILGINDRIV